MTRIWLPEGRLAPYPKKPTRFMGLATWIHVANVFRDLEF